LSWTLTAYDATMIAEALLHPRVPSARMRAALRRYRQRIKASQITPAG